MRLRIRTNNPPGKLPHGANLRVENAETGELLDHVTAVDIHCDSRAGIVKARIDISNVQLDVEAVTDTDVA